MYYYCICIKKYLYYWDYIDNMFGYNINLSISLYDVIEFGLLLPAGIIALIEKKVNEEVFKI